eukprot:6200280-Pleurochrysis_carterae.AAC.1
MTKGRTVDTDIAAHRRSAAVVDIAASCLARASTSEGHVPSASRHALYNLCMYRRSSTREILEQKYKHNTSAMGYIEGYLLDEGIQTSIKTPETGA